ncbi:MAG TPA: oxygenase MpaB family protein [Humibacter sp.]|nr:oxygenase MpaB family protein [Humibacter sp.]
MTRGLRDIAAEGILLAGGGRAILLQIAHPAVGRGVAEHSDFASRPLDRLRATMTYVYAVVYGNATQKAEVRRRVNAAHAPVHAPASDGSTGYDAYDPELQLWVAATLYDTAVDLYQRVFGQLDEESADRVYREYAVIGTALQVPQETWPADRAAFQRYWSGVLPTLRADPATRRVVRELLMARGAPLWLRALMPWARLCTVALLPADVRQAFALTLTSRNQRRFDRFISMTRAVYPRLPVGVRHALRDALLRDLRVAPA